MIKDYMEVLDRRICDVEPYATNTDTYREYINNSYDALNKPRPELKSHDDVELCMSYLNYMLGH